MLKFNFYTKIVSIVIVLLIPVLLLYVYSNQTTTGVLREELNQSNYNQLTFFQNQVNTNIEMISSWPHLLIHDPDVASFQAIFLKDKTLNLDGINLVKRIQTKLGLQESSSNWRTGLSIYSPSLGRVVSENGASYYDQKKLRQSITNGWQVSKKRVYGKDQFIFSLYTLSPFSSLANPETANTIIKVEFDSSNIQDMLDRFKGDGRKEPFYYKKGVGVIYNRSANEELSSQLIAKLEKLGLHEVDNLTVKIGEESYLVHAVLSQTTGWYLIDYMPLSDMMSPIYSSNRLFYLTVVGSLLVGIIGAYLLHSQVQVPILQLVRAFRRLKDGDYAVRLSPKGSHEFAFLSRQFNLMVEQIQELFEKVYVEKLHVKEARLKQLQSQINPHFFYNCFSFITSMAKLRNHEAVVAMAHNLSKYYRYTTRQERDLVPLSDEVEFVQYYLKIQQMRMPRLTFTIDISSQASSLLVPPLVLQPLVENAVLHGIEPQAEEGIIRIMTECIGSSMYLIVDDNGLGLSEEDITSLTLALEKPVDEKSGYGLWNVHQRMRLHFGENGGLEFSLSPLGGLRVILKWPLSMEEGQEDGVFHSSSNSRNSKLEDTDGSDIISR
ncbi:sensor histidine kinase [Paenibacillus polymyxa]|uniref:sensor histidine kinase n=1 Tax=Paenibacillus TaxID=44249 RepID=UPI0005ED1F5D|nr:MULTISPECIES: sensor histidine kinase [Paenibacillus]KAF6659079.1 sensor histidine kinase [Paenibacillus sp. EKM301P]KJK30408.1 histidine kinase [Paenibacillus polymyxa]RPE02760.1 sensor histidine kinase [Paenibacillus polymyxa]UBS85617.1 sensor histidine kinase [Paenibacillus polymyxa]WHX34134.1 sensor histidine kinase [Paenibacillus polymyxa]